MLLSTPLDYFISTLSGLDIVGILVPIGVVGLIGAWLMLPFVVVALYRSTSHCHRELRALNRKLDVAISRLMFEPTASPDVTRLEPLQTPVQENKHTPSSTVLH